MSRRGSDSRERVPRLHLAHPQRPHSAQLSFGVPRAPAPKCLHLWGPELLSRLLIRGQDDPLACTPPSKPHQALPGPTLPTSTIFPAFSAGPPSQPLEVAITKVNCAGLWSTPHPRCELGAITSPAPEPTALIGGWRDEGLVPAADRGCCEARGLAHSQRFPQRSELLVEGLGVVL